MIVALDFSDVDEARAMARRLAGTVGVYKIGLELVYSGGLTLAQELRDQGRKVFLDLKLHDIPNTVERATAQIARLGAHFLTVHAYPQTMRAAAAGAQQTPDGALALLGVTALTSYSDADLAEAGYALGADDLVALRTGQAKEAGLAGLVLSADEAAMARAAIGSEMILVTPGIRPVGAERGDQKRAATPAAAIRTGSDYLVVGRPILQASDPRAAAEAIVAEIAEALQN